MLKNSASSTEVKQEKKAVPNSQVAANEYDEIDQIYDYVRGLAALPKNLNNFEFISEATTPYTEPKLPHHQNNYHPPKEIREVSKIVGIGSTRSSSNNFSKTDTNFLNSSQWIKHELMEKPIPPSLKTIPSKKLQNRRPTLIFGKNALGSTHCPKISSPQKEVTELSPQRMSPLFHIR